MLIGLKSCGKLEFFFLSTGVMVAIFHAFGKTLAVSEKFIMCVRVPIICGRISLINLRLIPS